VSLDIRWRDVAKRGIAAWANQTLDDRVLDLLSDIMLATEAIETMVASERSEPPFPGFFTALDRIYSEAASLIGNVIASEGKPAKEH
jgi:hypothetical protein